MLTGLSRLLHRRLLRRLQSIRAATNEILNAAPRSIGGPINWGDLSCTSAQFCMDDTGANYTEVLVGEAGEGCGELRDYVHAKLIDTGWPDVDVRTEW